VNHGLPNGTLMQIPLNPFNNVVSSNSQVLNPLNTNYINRFNNGLNQISNTNNINGIQGIPPFSSNFMNMDPSYLNNNNDNLM